MFVYVVQCFDSVSLYSDFLLSLLFFVKIFKPFIFILLAMKKASQEVAEDEAEFGEEENLDVGFG